MFGLLGSFDQDLYGAAAVIAALGSAAASVIGVLNRHTAKDATRTVHRVEASTDALHQKVDDKLVEHEAIVSALQAIADEAKARQRSLESLIGGK